MGGYEDRGRYDVYEDWKYEREYLDFTVNTLEIEFKKKIYLIFKKIFHIFSVIKFNH